MDAQLKALAFDQLLQEMPAGIAILNTRLQYQSINNTLAQFNGKSVTEHLGQSVCQVLPNLYPIIGPMLEAVLATGQSILNFTIANEQLRTNSDDWFGSYIALIDEHGVTQGILVLAVNQTVAQRIERERERDLHRMREVLNHMFAFAGVLDTQGILLDANNPPLQQANLSLEQVQHKAFWQCPWWSHNSEVAQLIERAVLAAQSGQTSRFDTTAFMGNRVIDLDFMIAPMYSEGQLQYLIPSAIEITDRKQTEMHLKESESRFKQVFDCVGDGLIAVDTHGCIKLVNARAKEMFGYAQDELIGQHVEVLVPEPSREYHQQVRGNYLLTPSSRGMALRQELFARRKDGSLFPVEIGLTYLPDDPTASVLATITDVTKAKEIQRNLEDSLSEKSALLLERTTLLNEVHHRVKNNLQIISSLLNLQARAAPPELQSSLTESQLRVRAMALTHQMLYENNSFNGVSLSQYLKQLSQLLGSSLFANPHIKFVYQALDETIEIDIDKTISCGLLVNEILTNSLKHAFPNQRPGTIYLTLQRADADFCQLVIADDGVGMKHPPNFGKEKSMGMQLIPAFIAQLNAQFSLQHEHGTRYEFLIPLLQGG